MFSYKVLVLVLFTVKGHISHTELFNISMGIVDTRTVISCKPSIYIYSSFDVTKLVSCPCVRIEEESTLLIEMKILIQDEEEITINLSSPFISPPKAMIKLANNSLLHSSNITQFSTYYLSFSSELMCRYSSLKNTTICFYYPSSANFIDIEQYFEKITNASLVLPIQTRQRFLMIIIVIGILVLIICLVGLYILCSSRLPYHHMIQLDYIIDQQLAREAALKLGPEPV